MNAATDSMWAVVESRVLAGNGGCSVVGSAVLSAGAATGDGVTCESTYFRGAKLKANWKIERMQFAGAEAKFPPRPPGGDGGALGRRHVAQHAVGRRGDLERDLVGLELDKGLILLDRFTGLLGPARHRGLGHGLAEGRGEAVGHTRGLQQ